jgi:cytochrome c-type protein NapC
MKFKQLTGSGSLVMIVSVFVIGILFWSGFNAAMDWTNTEDFCVSFHEMRVNLEEYEDGFHDKNRIGVVATCPDCHVPKEFGPKLWAKLRASKDSYHHLMGAIDTKEKYEDHRLQMAQVVWAKMEATDSRECRNCHSVEAMLLDEQQGRAVRKHEYMQEKGKTCIDCHKGVAHELPLDYEEPEDEG